VAAAVPASADGRRALGGRRVLLAEDNETSREYIRALLVRAGCTVATAVNGLAAVRWAMDEAFSASAGGCVSTGGLILAKLMPPG